MKIINLTPHPLVLKLPCAVCNGEGRCAHPECADHYGQITTEIASSGIARCEEHAVEVGEISTATLEHVATGRPYVLIPVVTTVYGKVTGLPEPQTGVIYVVSSITAQACRDRNDVYVPARVVRDGLGRIIGCAGLGRIG